MKPPETLRNTLHRLILGGVLAIPLLLSMPSCHWLRTPEVPPSPRTGLVTDTKAPKNSVGIEVYYIRLMPQQENLLQQLWMEVDELAITDHQLRHDLMEHGFRVGVQGAVLSKTLSKLLNISESEETGHSNQFGQFTEVDVSDIPRDPTVQRFIWNLMSDMQVKLTLYDDPQPDLSLFRAGPSGLIRGETYQNALSMMTVSAVPEYDGRVRFQLMPELEYGEKTIRYEFKSGFGYMDNRRPSLPFTNLTVPLNLYPGQWIIVGPSQREDAGLGHAFFTRDDGRQRKLLVIRLTNVQRPLTDPNIGTLPEPAQPSGWTIQDRH